MTLAAGAKLGPYEITGPLGAGGMGEVYRALDPRLGREVAIKVSREQFSERFEREARAVAALNHPNICTLYDVGPNYLVMELIEGETLKGPLPLATALDYARQIASALESAHEKGIIHRDLKPANTKIKPDGTVKVLDFGLAKVDERNVSGENSPTLTIGATEAGAVMGTAAYMSPEQARGEPVDRRADIWSFGVVLFEMLTGRRLFSATTAPETLSKVLLGEIDLDGLPAETPETIRQLLLRCLDRDVKNRLRDIGEARYLLSRPIEAHLEPTAPQAKPNRSFRPGWVVLAAIPLLIVLLGLYRISMEPESAASHRFLPFATEGHGERNPVWSPDGRTIAYVASIEGKDQIYTRATNAASSFKIVQCPALCDVVGWSGDGSRVYYHSRSTHLDARVWSAARSGGAPARLFPEDLTVLASAVSPDGQRLAMIQIFVDEKQGRKARLVLSEPPGAAPIPVGAFPVVNLVQPHAMAWFADSDRFLVFSPAVGNRMFLVSASQKKAREVAAGVPPILGLSWSRESRFAVAALQPEPGARLYWFNVDTGAFSPFRRSELAVTSVAVAPDGQRLAFTLAEEDLDLMEIPLDGSPVRPLVASRLRESDARYSPLSDEFAYVTGDQIRIRQPRSMAERVAVSDVDFPAGTVRGGFRHPAFSPDGLQIAYNKRFQIWISPANGGQAVPLEAESGQFGAEWSPDGVWLGFNWAKPQGSGLFKRRVGSTEPKIRLTDGMCGAGPAWSPDGVWIACSLSPSVMSLIPSGGGPPKHVASGYEPHAVWSRDGEHLYLIRRSGDRRELGKLSWRSGTFQPLHLLPEGFVISGSAAHAGRMSLSYDGRSIIATVARATGDIWILDGFRPPRPFWKRMLGVDRTQVPSGQNRF